MPTRRGSLVVGGAPADKARPPTDSALRHDLAVATDACQGRDSFDDDCGPIPVKVLGPMFENAAMAPPPPRGRVDSSAKVANDSLRVYCRLRPLNRGETGDVIETMDEHTVRAMPLQRPGRHAHREARDYLFTKVFNGETAQQTVYDDATAPLVDALFEGRSALLFTYGVTNAGKSYTMMGKPEGDEAGIMPRALDAVLERANKEETSEVYVSFIEIYNEQIYDLMDKKTATKRRALRLKDRGDRMEVNNLSSQRVTSVSHGLALARAAAAQRKTAATGLNSTSSRSHSICQLELRSPQRPPVQLMLVDLAGSERIERTGAQATGEQQKEANHINQSVSRLMHCLRVLRDKQAPSAQLSAVVPWRESKLTHLFQNHLAPSNGSPAARVAMIVNVSPSAADHAESCYVMGNAASAKAVAVRAAAPTAAAQGAKRAVAYDHNGRRLEGGAPLPPPTAADAKKRKLVEQDGRALERHDSSSSLAETNSCDGRDSSITMMTHDEAGILLQRVEEMAEALAAARDEVSEVERDVRHECAEEMQRAIEQIQKDYARRLRARSSSVAGGNPHPLGAVDEGPQPEYNAAMDVDDGAGTSPQRAAKRAKDVCQSARKEQQRDELERYVESLEEQFEETEAELERVRADSAAEAASLRAQLAAAGVGADDDAMAVDARDRRRADDDADDADALRDDVERLQAALAHMTDASAARHAELAAALEVAQAEAGVWHQRCEAAEAAARSAAMEHAAATTAVYEAHAFDVAGATAASAAALAERDEQHASALDRCKKEATEAQARASAQAAMDRQHMATDRASADRASADRLQAERLQADRAQAAATAAKRGSGVRGSVDSSASAVSIYTDAMPGEADAQCCLNALKRSAPLSPQHYAASAKKAPDSPPRSPFRENSPVVSRSVKAVATSLDARARKLKDERIARAKAQRAGDGAPPGPSCVAKRTRGYKVL